MILPLLLAVITCTELSDGSWICQGDSYTGIDEINGEYVCTNCTAISPEQCVLVRQSVLDYIDSVTNQLSSLESNIYDAHDTVDSLKSSLGSFTPCPYDEIVVTGSGAMNGALGAAGYTTTSTGRLAYAEFLLSEWHSTENYNVTRYDPVLLNPGQGLTQAAAYAFHNELVAAWKCSYQVAQNYFPTVESAYFRVADARDAVPDIRSAALSARSYASSVTCAPCTVGSTGGSGSTTGCLECYLQYLRSLDSNIGRMLDSVNTIKQSVSVLGGNITNQINSLIRLQSNFYNQFNRTDNANNQQRLGSIVSEDLAVFGQGFNESAFNDLPWFKRVELLLYKVANPTNAPVEQIDDDSIQSTLEGTSDDLSESIERFVNGSETLASSLGSIRDVVTSLQSALAHSAPLTDGVTLIEGGSWISDEPLVLRINITIQNALHAFFSCLWLVLVSVVVWRVSTAAWSKVIALVRWLLSLIDL